MHMLPMDGNIDFDKTAHEIAKSAAERIGVTTRAIQKWAKAGRLPDDELCGKYLGEYPDFVECPGTTPGGRRWIDVITEDCPYAEGEDKTAKPVTLC